MIWFLGYERKDMGKKGKEEKEAEERKGEGEENIFFVL